MLFRNNAPADFAMRVSLINMLAELLLSEDVDETDIIELLDDWMEENFSVETTDSSHTEIAKYLLRVRKELTFCALNDLDLPSGSKTLFTLKKFNDKMQGNAERVREA